MEELLHYVWKHKLLPLSELETTDGRIIEILDPGLHNRNAGPDFFNAKVKIGGTPWAGNVEIHLKASDWYRHGHDRDPRYNNVVLHVVALADMDVKTLNGDYLPQLVLQIPQVLKENYEELLHNDQYPPCYRIIPDLTRLTVHSWMAALQTERLEQKTQWALNVPLHAVGKHRDDLFQIEAIFMGQAGLLQLESIPERYQAAALNEGYFAKLRNEYLYLAHKFSLKPMSYEPWQFLRLRPQNFPHIRIAQLANLYYERKAGLSMLLECETLDQLRQLLQTHVTPYWETHFLFGAESPQSSKKTSISSANLLIINTAIPMLFAVGRHRQREDLCDRAFDFLEQLKAVTPRL